MSGPPQKPLDPRVGLQAYLLLEALVRAWLWGISMAITAALFVAVNGWPPASLNMAHPVRTMWDVSLMLGGAILSFNVIYLLVLIVVRLPIPNVKEGRYPLGERMKLDRNIVCSCIIAILTKARYQAPFPGFLIFNIANIPPFSWLMYWVFGPKTRSCNFVDPLILDPHLVEIGRNVVIGFNTIIAGHAQERDAVFIRKTVIEDDVVLGGNVIVFGGCTIGHGAVVLSGATVTAGTDIGPNELWGGLPAKKIKDLPPFGSGERATLTES